LHREPRVQLRSLIHTSACCTTSATRDPPRIW
jgi:hypothetical protein